ncbi:MAG: DUF255 domain-containing protein [Saprospiraceae bacterium]|nr:DUF255 domain-containing protein [Saprospiraceae bacterium]
MKKVLSIAAFLSFSYLMAAQTSSNTAVNWYTWEEAIAANKEEPKKLFIDVYTDWCGWCKKMDQTTFSDPKVAAYLNENFYPVKFNAEQRESIVYDGHELKYKQAGRRGVHELAYSLLNGRLSYPSYVYLDEERKRITISPGYKAAEPFLKEIKYIGEDHYKTTSYQQYLEQE